MKNLILYKLSIIWLYISVITFFLILFLIQCSIFGPPNIPGLHGLGIIFCHAIKIFNNTFGQHAIAASWLFFCLYLFSLAFSLSYFLKFALYTRAPAIAYHENDGYYEYMQGSFKQRKAAYPVDDGPVYNPSSIWVSKSGGFGYYDGPIRHD